MRVIHSFKYHGKLYCFYKNKKFFSAILGSANFSFLGEKKENQRQYELATLFRNKKILKQISDHIEQIKQKDCSENISFLNNIQIISEKGETIPNIDPIETKKVAIVQKLQESNPRYVFHLPLKVPSYRNRFSPLRSNYTKSNLNACYGAPRGKGGPHRS
ncbi:NgoFVII family restriction endonuclease [Microbacterium esteraromaticum]|nr:NgoFVII family restriction endonuclease [Microbacterium esteraromaticum]